MWRTSIEKKWREKLACMYLVKEIDLNWTFYLLRDFSWNVNQNSQNDQRDHTIVQ